MDDFYDDDDDDVECVGCQHYDIEQQVCTAFECTGFDCGSLHCEDDY